MNVLRSALLVLFIYSLNLSANSQDVEWGEPSKEIGNGSKTLGKCDNSIFIFSEQIVLGLSNKNKYKRAIVRLDEQMNVTLSEELNLKIGKETHEFVDIEIVDNDIRLLTKFFQRKSKSVAYFVSTIDQQNLQVRNTKKIFDVEPIKGVEPVGFTPSGFIYAISKTASSNDIQIFEGAGERVKEASLGISDISGGSWTLTKVEFDMESSNVFISAMQKVTKEESKANKNAIQKYCVFVIGADDYAEQHLLEIEENKRVNSIYFALEDNGDLICTGFYSSAQNHFDEGMYYTRIDASDLDLSEFRTMEFTEQFVRGSFKTEKEVKLFDENIEKEGDSFAALGQMKVKEVVMREGGGFSIVSEMQYNNVISTRDANGNTTTTITYYNLELCVVHVGEGGEFDWVARIPKMQIANSRTYSSYHVYEQDDNLEFLYTSSSKNVGLDSMMGMENFSFKKSTAIFKASLDSNGGLTISAPDWLNSHGLPLVARMCENLDNGKVLIVSRKQGKVQFGTIDR